MAAILVETQIEVYNVGYLALLKIKLTASVYLIISSNRRMRCCIIFTQGNVY